MITMVIRFYNKLISTSFNKYEVVTQTIISLARYDKIELPIHERVGHVRQVLRLV